MNALSALLRLPKVLSPRNIRRYGPWAVLLVALPKLSLDLHRLARRDGPAGGAIAEGEEGDDPLDDEPTALVCRNALIVAVGQMRQTWAVVEAHCMQCVDGSFEAVLERTLREVEGLLDRLDRLDRLGEGHGEGLDGGGLDGGGLDGGGLGSDGGGGSGSEGALATKDESGGGGGSESAKGGKGGKDEDGGTDEESGKDGKGGKGKDGKDEESGKDGKGKDGGNTTLPSLTYLADCRASGSANASTPLLHVLISHADDEVKEERRR